MTHSCRPHFVQVNRDTKRGPSTGRSLTHRASLRDRIFLERQSISSRNSLPAHSLRLESLLPSFLGPPVRVNLVTMDWVSPKLYHESTPSRVLSNRIASHGRCCDMIQLAHSGAVGLLGRHIDFEAKVERYSMMPHLVAKHTADPWYRTVEPTSKQKIHSIAHRAIPPDAMDFRRGPDIMTRTQERNAVDVKGRLE